MTKLVVAYKNKYLWIIFIILTFILTYYILLLLNSNRIEAENLALGSENTSRYEYYNGLNISSPNVGNLLTMIESLRDESISNYPRKLKYIPILGNSQLHTINDYNEGDHLTAYWLRDISYDKGCLNTIGISLANVNPQEIEYISKWLHSKIELSAVVYQIEFMGFRENALRSELSKLNGQDTTGTSSSISDNASNIISTSNNSAALRSSNMELDGLDGDHQQSIEKWLSSYLGEISSLWRHRAELRSSLLGSLFELRNFVFQINSKSIRRALPHRYNENMTAFLNVVRYFKQNKIPMLVYFAPLRSDIPIPYDKNEFLRWKNDIIQIANSEKIELVDLTDIIPGPYWGTNFGDDVDFMHFKNYGHLAVAKTLYPYINKITGSQCSLIR